MFVKLNKVFLFSFFFFLLMFLYETSACSKPVFRYALEKWDVDPYLVTIVYKDKLSEEGKNVLNYYKKFYDEERGIILSTYRVNDKLLPLNIRNIVSKYKKEKLPLVIVSYPPYYKNNLIVGIYPLTMDAAKLLMEAVPGREVARRIMKGDAIVFLQLDCDNEKANQATAEKVEKELLKLDEKFNKSDENNEYIAEEEGYDNPKIHFSLIRISRKESRNIPFITMLLNSSKDFKEVKTPIIFPIFGRGRVLCGLYGEDINSDNIEGIADFINGSCSCEIKAQNPGFDILIPVDWLDFINDEETVANSLPSTSLMKTASVDKEKSKIDSSGEKNNSKAGINKITIMFSGGFILVCLFLLLVYYKRANKSK